MIECKGRNGYFRYFRNVVTVLRGFRSETNEAWVCIYSKRHGNSAPIVITGDPEEISTLLRAISDELKRKNKTLLTADKGGTHNDGD